MNQYISEYIKKSHEKGPVGTLNEFLLESNESDTNYNNTYNAKVIDNNDPGKLGRCRVRIFGIHGDDIQDDDLPWALPDFSFVGSLMGSFIVPPNDTIVSVYFENGDRYLPRYTRKVVDEKNMPSDKDEDYPDNMIFYETDNGDKYMINRKQKTTTIEHSSGTKMFIDSTTYEVEHNTGTKITIDTTGNVIIDAVGNIETNHKLLKKDNGGLTVPGAMGPFCAIPICPITGAQHIGQQCGPGL